MKADTADPVVVVVAAVIERNGRFLIAQRPHGHLAGYWEFPGGKCNPDESHTACLVREIDEELGVEARVGEEIMVTEHAYADRTVRLHFRKCVVIGEPFGKIGQALRWVQPAELRSARVPDADRDVVNLLCSGK